MNLLKLTCYEQPYIDEKSREEYTIIINTDNIDFIHPSYVCEDSSIISVRGEEFTIKVPFDKVINYL